MAVGDITMDGGPLPPRNGREMCEYIVAAGLYQGTPESLWNYSKTGELTCVFDLYYMALSKNGHQLALELPGGQHFQWPILGPAAPREAIHVQRTDITEAARDPEADLPAGR